MTAYDRSLAALRSPDRISIEVRFLSSLTRFSDHPKACERIEVAAETTVGDLVARYGLPLDEIVRVLSNGQDMNPGLYTGGNLDLGASISDGDVITFAGVAPVIPGTRSAAV